MDDAATLIADAFELANARGSTLLEALGRFDLWRGDLGSMRGDPASQQTTSEQPSSDAASRLHRATMLSQSLRYLPSRCREALEMTFGDHRSVTEVARSLETTPRDAEALLANCTDRLFEIARKIGSDANAPEETQGEPWKQGLVPEEPRTGRRG